MRRKIFRFMPVALIALVGVVSTGCMPRIYDDNPHFSHHRNPPKPMPPARPMPVKPALAPGKPGVAPAPGRPTKPAPTPAPTQPAPGRPGTNNHR